jgi:hypothetical protein
MQYIKFEGGTEYCQCDFTKYVAFTQDLNKKQLDRYAADLATENAEQFIQMATEDLDREDFDDEEDYLAAYDMAEDSYYEDIYSSYTIVSQKEWEDNHGEIVPVLFKEE